MLDFLGRYYVRCPQCGDRATVSATGSENLLFSPRRLCCTKCGHTAKWDKSSVLYPLQDDPTDWFFGLPYYFQKRCAGHVLWVANREHLEFLRNYVGAKLRSRAVTERGWTNRSLASRLPRWLTAAKHRDTVLSSLDGLEAKMTAIP